MRRTQSSPGNIPQLARALRASPQNNPPFTLHNSTLGQIHPKTTKFQSRLDAVIEKSRGWIPTQCCLCRDRITSSSNSVWKPCCTVSRTDPWSWQDVGCPNARCKRTNKLLNHNLGIHDDTHLLNGEIDVTITNFPGGSQDAQKFRLFFQDVRVRNMTGSVLLREIRRCSDSMDRYSYRCDSIQINVLDIVSVAFLYFKEQY